MAEKRPQVKQNNNTPAHTRAKLKYNTENYDRLYGYSPKGRKEAYKLIVERSDDYDSVNEFILRAIEEKIKRENLETLLTKQERSRYSGKVQ